MRGDIRFFTQKAIEFAKNYVKFANLNREKINMDIVLIIITLILFGGFAWILCASSARLRELEDKHQEEWLKQRKKE